MGFGWSFYGFFLAAGIWMALYFAGVRVIETRERRRAGR